MKRELTQGILLLVLLIACFKAEAQNNTDYKIQYFLEDIGKTKEQVDKYTSPKEKLYLVSEANLPWLKRSVSKKSRETWTKDLNLTPAEKKKVDDALDALGVSAAQKLPKYIPDEKNFAVHNQAEEDLMKTGVSDISEAKIHKIGLRNTVWTIEKDSYNTPLHRFKQGFIWLRYPANDHPYCHLLQVNIIQQYAGGGTYGESYAKLVYNDYCGCPD